MKANGPDAKRTNLPLRKTGESLPVAAVTLVTLALIVGCVIQTAKDGVSARAVWTSLVLTLALLLMDMVLIGIRNAGRYLKWVALGVFAAGVLVHFYGYFEFGVRPVPTTLLRSAIASAEMFFSESNLDGIIIENPAILEKHLYVPLYVIIYSSALSVSLFYLFSVFGKRLRSRIWLRRHRRDLTGSGSAPWFVMLRINDNAIALAKDLVGKGNPGGHVIFLEEPEDEEEEARISLSNLRDFFSVVDGPEERVRRLVDDPDVVLLRMKGRVQDAAGTGGPMSAQALCQAIGLGGLADWLSFAGSPEEAAPSVSLFVIGESEKDNLAACRSLAALTDISCRIYCHAHPEDPMVYYPDTAEGNGTVVEFVDTARLAVEQLKKECTPDGVFPYHPINYVDSDRERGCVTSTFTGLLLGFGQTGQEALDFLYSFGAFLGPNGRRSPFEFAVYDSRMEELSGRYLAARRGMDFSTIHFIESSVGSTGFWDQFTTFDRTVFRKPFFERVNYVIVSLGDDELNFRTGCDLFDFMCRNRKDDGETGRFIVMVHARTSTPLMEKKVAFFNKMYGDRARIALFGRREDTWRYDIVTNASLFELASRFYDAYRRAAGEKVQGSFMERHARLVADMEAVNALQGGEFERTLRRINKMRRQEMQDIENALHRYTKLRLCPEEYRGYASRIANGYPAPGEAGGETVHPGGDREMVHFPEDRQLREIYNLFENLAVGEHIRWQASHETMGYVYGEVTDDILKTHCCIIPYGRLNEVDEKSAREQGAGTLPRYGETKHYDWIVVKTSLMLDAPSREPEGLE